jgi:hypothetical protein
MKGVISPKGGLRRNPIALSACTDILPFHYGCGGVQVKDRSASSRTLSGAWVRSLR